MPGLRVLMLLAAVAPATSSCPMGGTGEPPLWHPQFPEGGPAPLAGYPPAAPPSREEYYAALEALDFDAVEEDLAKALKTSQPWWPADWGKDVPPPLGKPDATYGPLMVRLAWHCAGTYRESDGRGGCAGGRQRFEPERSWPDNTNLDKARALLEPIKRKYGVGLSWGDLFTLAGNVAIKTMGGPVLGFCAGREDEMNGWWSDALGPTAIQESLNPCPGLPDSPANGKCATSSGLGASTVGLIYVDPEGPMKGHNPYDSAKDIRDVFGRMGMNDSETVALIGGGHAFGKTHGPCPSGPGPAPDVAIANPWPGLCGTGKGPDTFTSGLEGPWTIHPTKWDNQYFQALLRYEWKLGTSPAGQGQWAPYLKGKPVPSSDPVSKTMMLTTDVALLRDEKYLELVHRYAQDLSALEHDFSNAWYKLLTRDMGPYSRCRGPRAPPPQAFQYPLPDPKLPLPDYQKIVSRIQTDLLTGSSAVANAKKLVRLAFSSAWTYRVTDHRGGANGARIRFSPEQDWPINHGSVPEVLGLLKPIFECDDAHGLSWADLIVLAGTVALQDASGVPLQFCGGRADAEGGEGSIHLEPRISRVNDLGATVAALNLYKDFWTVMGMSIRETVALSVISPTRHDSTHSKLDLSASYFSEMVSNDWCSKLTSQVGKTVFVKCGATRGSDGGAHTSTYGKGRGVDGGAHTGNYGAPGNLLQREKGLETEREQSDYDGSSNGVMLGTDLVLNWDTDYKTVLLQYLEPNGEHMLLKDLSKAWTKLMMSGMFGGPVGRGQCITVASTVTAQLRKGSKTQSFLGAADDYEGTSLLQGFVPHDGNAEEL